MIRPLIQEVVELIKRTNDREPPRIIIEAPTGYGKSVSGSLIYEPLYEQGFCGSFIHVLPLRAIVRDLYVCTLLNAVIPNKFEDVCREGPLTEVNEVINRLGMTHKDIAYQMGELVIGEELSDGVIRKEPLYDAKYVVTTLDSFIYNLFRIPVSEIFSRKKHYAIPRLRIFVSAVYLDEAHFIFEEDADVSTIYTAVINALGILSVFKSPMVIASATLSRKAIEQLTQYVKNPYIVRLGIKHNHTSSRVIEVCDEEFIQRVTSVRWATKLVSDEELIEEAIGFVNNGQKVLIVRDSIERAVSTYKKLCEELPSHKVLLIHGRLTRGDREEVLNKFRNADLVVSTSVIEAGVNVSFNVLLTDGMRPTSVIQRAGRVCRFSECNEGFVGIIKEHSSMELLDFVNHIISNGREICWRLPFDIPNSNYRGYGTLLDTIELPAIDSRLKNELEAIAYPMFVSSSVISNVLKSRGYTLARVGIIEITIGDLNDIKQLDYGDLIARSLTVPTYVVDKLLRNGCIIGFIGMYGEANVAEVKLVCEVSKLAPSGKFNMREYVSCLQKAHKEGDPIYTSILVKRECYADELGLIL